MVIFKLLAICGMLSPIIYTLLWIIGGIIVPNYSHKRDDVSSLFAIDAYKRWFFQTFFIIVSVLTLAFNIGLHWGVNSGEGSIVGPILFIISSVIGLLVTCFFPLDAGGEITTWRGKMHLILVIITGILTLVAMVLMFFRLLLVDGWKGFAIFSLVAAIMSLILVTLSAIFAGGEYMGLVERFMVSEYQIYYFVISLLVFLRN